MPEQIGAAWHKRTTRRKAMDSVSRALLMVSGGGPSGPPAGQIQYTTNGTYTFVPPPGVDSFCIVCVGAGGDGFSYAGGLAWRNNISVGSGPFTVLISSSDSRLFSPTTTFLEGRGANTGGDFYAPGGGGGNGGKGSGPGGGGAGGYTGNGGDANGTGPSAGSGGGGGGGVAGPVAYEDLIYVSSAGGGGGVGLLGQGSNGAAGAGDGQGGGGGSGGDNGGQGNYGSNGGSGGFFGGGGGGPSYIYDYDFNLLAQGSYGSPGGGAVRIIWGTGRSFPSTNTGNV
jgi:hypothetical protein